MHDASLERQGHAVPGTGGPLEPDWLTAVLRESGALSDGHVIAVEQAPTSAFNSDTVRVQVELSADAAGAVPSAMILKRNTAAAWSVRAGQAEVAFYRLIAASPGHPAGIVRCLACGIDEAGDSFLLLDDVSSTHKIVVPRDVQIAMADGVPPDRDIMAAVDTLARIHAYWWERVTEPVEISAWSRDDDGFTAYLHRRAAAWQSVLRRDRSWLPADVTGFYPRVLTALRPYWERELKDRMRNGRQLTLVHGDAYFANFLSSVAPGTGFAYLIDWQSPSFDIGAADLVNMCATFWTAEQRGDHSREERVLRRYHDQLLADGVTGYTFADLAADYARALIDWVLVPVQDAADGSAWEYWWPKMQCLLAAYRDWNCDVMLGVPA